ncbi:MAG: hypothetical protein KME47_16485 [Nodosilinea sp. WJT8-NPBG4]|jgi:hypothetical protein|nr:hypothetical protein [Nodosilinea sp. WJT8-NPBG4]
MRAVIEKILIILKRGAFLRKFRKESKHSIESFTQGGYRKIELFFTGFFLVKGFPSFAESYTLASQTFQYSLRTALSIITQSFMGVFLFLKYFVPNFDFLSDVIAFQGAVVAIAYPLSLEIVSRISERYHSGVIIKKFNKEWQVRTLPYLLISSVIIATLLKFFSSSNSDEVEPPLARALAWLVITLFITSTILLISFFLVLRRYAVDTELLVAQLLADMQGLIKLNSTDKIKPEVLIEKQNKLISAFEGVGDILSYEVRNRRSDKYLTQTLREMRIVIKDFLDLKFSHPEEFEKLLLPPDFHEEYQDIDRDTQFLINLKPEKYFITFTLAISQFSRIHEVAAEAKNLEIGNFALVNFVKLLRDMSQKPGNELFVKQVLNSFSLIQRKAISAKDTMSANTASIGWYANIVFDATADSFELSYLDLFNEYFFRSAQFLISKGATEIYERLISNLTNGIHLPSGKLVSPADYKDMLEVKLVEDYSRANAKYLLEQRFDELESFYEKAMSPKDYIEFLDKMEPISNIEEIRSLCHKDEVIGDMPNQVRKDLTNLIKKKNLDSLLIAFGAYCLFKQRYDYIKHMWEFNQPPDSDAMWLNHSIVPLTLEGVIAQYSRRDYFESKFSIYWDDHHGARIYFDKYFLLLLMKALQVKGQTREILQQRIETFRIPAKTDIHFLSSLNDSIDRYVILGSQIYQDQSMAENVGFDLTQSELWFDFGFDLFMKTLKSKIEIHLNQLLKTKTISKTRIQEFRNNFKKSFEKAVKIRKIFVNYDLFEDRSQSESDELKEQFASGSILDKAAFFEDWHSHYIQVGETYGRQYAVDEDSNLLETLINWSMPVDHENFSDTLEMFEEDIDNVFILAINSSLNNFFRKHSEFKSKWTNQNLVSENDLQSLAGWLEFTGFDIPIYEIYCEPREKFILVLNRKKLGRLIQYLPKKGWRAKSRNDSEAMTGNFYLGIDSFSEDPTLMNSFLKEPPDWLSEYEGETSQREFLETQALLEISESFEMVKAEDFQGYVTRISSASDEIPLQ